jgi:PTS system mannitol-specific IIC component
VTATAVPAPAEQAPAKGSSARIKVQRFGTFLSGMIMPNIAAFIAWGFITALFIQTGWTPVGALGGFGNDSSGHPHVGLVGPMITYLRPRAGGWSTACAAPWSARSRPWA